MKTAKRVTDMRVAMFLLMGLLLAACGSSTEPGIEEGRVKVSLALSPATAEVVVGQSTSFTVTAQNTDFTVSAPQGAGCVRNGLLLTCTPTAAGTFTLEVVATADTTKKATAVLTATAPVVVSLALSPATAEVVVGQAASFAVTVQNTDFTVSAPQGAGCVRNGLLLTCTPTAAGTFTLEVVATADTTKKATAVLTATPAYKAHGFNFSPYENGQSPHAGAVIPLSQLRARMEIIAPYTEWVRGFGSTNGLENTCQVAREYGLKCLGGAWLSGDLAANERELSGLIQAGQEGFLDGAVVGSEVLLRGDLTETQLLGYMGRVRAALPGLPVTYADVYGKLLEHPNVMAASDFVFVNYYPYWEHAKVDHAVAQLHALHQRMLAAANGKEVVVSETGWPSDGNSMGEAVPSPENARFYFLNFVSWARANHVKYFYFAAFDEAWKVVDEGPQGAHWGRWDALGNMKAGSMEVFNGQTMEDNWSCMAMPGGQGTPTVELTYVPPRASPPESFNHLQGQVWHVLPADYRMVVYIQVAGNWWIKPYSDDRRKTSIRCDGSFSVNITTGGNDQDASSILAYLIPATYEPPIQLNMTVLNNNSVAKVQVDR